MYNEEKKLITDIERGKDVSANLETFADVVYKADFEYACHKFILNYITLKDKLFGAAMPEDAYVTHLDGAIDILVRKYIVDESEHICCDEADMKLISDMRRTITDRMKAITAYTDAFELYEYILNRREFRYEENMTDELSGKLDAIDTSAFGDEIFRFVFADEDKVAINARLQSVIGQLPIRMTKSRFCDILCDTLDIYKGAEIQTLDDFVQMIEATALIDKPDGFDSVYPDLKKAYDELSNTDYEKLDYDGYSRLTGIKDRSVDFMESLATDYLLMIELVNDLYVMMISVSAKEKASESCRTAVSILRDAAGTRDGDFGSVFDRLGGILGEQESAGEHRLMLESAVYDISKGCMQQIQECALTDRYRAIDRMDKLLSDSMFINIDDEDMPDVLTADTEYITAGKEKLTDEFMKLFERNTPVENRALMAKILSSIPVFFNSADEIKDYIDNSLSRCRDSAELLADYIVLKQLMEE